MIDDVKFAELVDRITREVDRADAHRCAHTIADITALSFLVEKGHATAEEVAQRLGQVQKSLPPGYQVLDVTRHIKFLAHALSEYSGPQQPG